MQVSKDDGRSVVERGNQLTYTLIYTNAGPGFAHNVVMTDTLPPTAINVSTPTVAGVITPTIQPGRVIFQLGTLPPNHVDRTTVTLTLGPTTASGIDIINSVVIGSTTPDPNQGITATPISTGPAARRRWCCRSSALCGRPGGVLLAWRTVAEQDNYGFRVYRSRTPSRADAALLTAQIIPGQGRGRADGAAYSFTDAEARRTGRCTTGWRTST